MTKTAVVALGGNALTLPGQAGKCEEMLARAAEMATAINEVMDAGWRVVVVHGNGPQVGNLALQQEATVTADEAARHLEEGQFPPGSMGPKIEAALRFLADGGDLAVITTPRLLARTLAGADADGGTRIEPSVSRVGPGR